MAYNTYLFYNSYCTDSHSLYHGCASSDKERISISDSGTCRAWLCESVIGIYGCFHSAKPADIICFFRTGYSRSYKSAYTSADIIDSN